MLDETSFGKWWHSCPLLELMQYFQAFKTAVLWSRPSKPKLSHYKDQTETTPRRWGVETNTKAGKDRFKTMTLRCWDPSQDQDQGRTGWAKTKTRVYQGRGKTKTLRWWNQVKTHNSINHLVQWYICSCGLDWPLNKVLFVGDRDKAEQKYGTFWDDVNYFNPCKQLIHCISICSVSWIGVDHPVYAALHLQIQKSVFEFLLVENHSVCLWNHKQRRK